MLTRPAQVPVPTDRGVKVGIGATTDHKSYGRTYLFPQTAFGGHEESVTVLGGRNDLAPSGGRRTS